jgi:hypothetical protein
MSESCRDSFITVTLTCGKLHNAIGKSTFSEWVPIELDTVVVNTVLLSSVFEVFCL